MKNLYAILLLSVSLVPKIIMAQDTLKNEIAVKELIQPTTVPVTVPDVKDLRYNLDSKGERYLRFIMLNQTWVRFNDNNPNTTVGGIPESQTFDIGIRRLRFQLIGQLSDRVLIYTQIGMNNFTYQSQRKVGLFVHDALVEYAAKPQKLHIGFGLNGWTGPSRFSSPSVGSILGLDAPIFEQTANDVNDQFLRKLGIYARGTLGKFQYRVAVSKPFMVTATPVIPGTAATVQTLGQLKAANQYDVSSYALTPPSIQVQSYLQYQFYEVEAQQTSYTQGTYLGKKKVFNVGFGAVYQDKATWSLNKNTNTGTIDTSKHATVLLAVDVFYDVPLNKAKGTALSFYGVVMRNDFGPNYLRNLGIMNPADGSPNNTSAGAPPAAPGLPASPAIQNSINFNNGGNAFAIQGTGTATYFQLGYLCKEDLLGKSGTLLPYVSCQVSKFDILPSWSAYTDMGVTWLIKGHQSKFTLSWQNRPVYYTANGLSKDIEQTRKSAVVLQYQIMF